MSVTVTLRLDEALERQLAEACRRSGKSRSEVLREALRRQLVVEEFRALRRELVPLAESRGYVTDDDVFRDVS
jgi:predicted transcriptional regulator